MKILPNEDVHLEYKELEENKLPKSIWETVSSFANTDGGTIILSVKELKHPLRNIATGLSDPYKLKQDFLNTQSSNKLSQAVASESDINEFEINGKKLLKIYIPKINYTNRPLYLNGNLRNAYKRENDSDRKISADELRAFIRESDADVDKELLPNFGLDDIILSDLQLFRSRLNDVSGNLYIDGNTEDFLINIGLMQKDRTVPNGNYLLTKAALLLFGKYNSIIQVFPSFMLDLIIKPNKTIPDYSDRVYTSNEPDHPNNIYGFYNAAYEKLSSITKNSFQLRGDTRIDIGDSLKRVQREALVNALVHADYESREPVKINAYKDYVEFNNPGEMRVSTETFINGGQSVPRNPFIFNAFVKAKLGEHTGSGGLRIYKTTSDLKLRAPEITTSFTSTSLLIWKVPLTEAVLQELPKSWRATYKRISEKLVVSYSDLKDLYKTSYEGHKILNEMVTKELIEKSGQGKGTKYSLPIDSPSARVSMNSYIRQIQQILDNNHNSSNS
ncbi:RNA-binding domain-containing protein [Limosilactobacillus sp.]|jgi:ATP-dependent DNA helicase RecG|uniref:RNA-binding domain-containing protein n=1 Tax=Limosilactobacillus sp. TaxID=2773925 RepID=UPI0025C41A45|nr:RNA-binding domain-containing protein [Limosilactobacillus sp.]MCH3922996.1 putative DNA binding domain-containing protein [Limosilactobacillus sp.]MCH3927679.1 putative DNA binding domain-containing protein [Limosilactobacillus sp.]